jgi:hypothetical protein
MYRATMAIDNVLPSQTVSLQSEMNVRELIESVFVQLQTAKNPDPFKFVIDYFGYDHYGGVTSYLGYGIASINQFVSDDNDYWDLFINGNPSTVGMDSYLVQPNDRIELKWTAVATASSSAGARM